MTIMIIINVCMLEKFKRLFSIPKLQRFFRYLYVINVDSRQCKGKQFDIYLFYFFFQCQPSDKQSFLQTTGKTHLIRFPRNRYLLLLCYCTWPSYPVHKSWAEFMSCTKNKRKHPSYRLGGYQILQVSTVPGVQIISDTL